MKPGAARAIMIDLRSINIKINTEKCVNTVIGYY